MREMTFGNGKRAPGKNGKDRKLIVRENRCPQDHLCPAVSVCPVGALTQNAFEAPVADQDTCTRCGKCVGFCPMRALVLE
ncbi:MAG: 4Fe-4S binding protein [Christensenellales bacterium]